MGFEVSTRQAQETFKIPLIDLQNMCDTLSYHSYLCVFKQLAFVLRVVDEVKSEQSVW